MHAHRSGQSGPSSLAGKVASFLLTAIAVALALGSATTAIAADARTVPSVNDPRADVRDTAQDDALSQDSDGDGLTDRLEIHQYGTNPANPDSDRDGVNDGDEVTLHASNPLGSDTDGDGLNDGVELALGTDLLRADSESDGLTDGEEIALGADPFNSDSDGDGLPDGHEVRALGSSAVHTDSDGDGLTDSDEVTLYNTNPAKPDAQRVFTYSPSDQQGRVPTKSGASTRNQPLQVGAATIEQPRVQRIPLVTASFAPVFLALD
jgi:hypothetical protein